MRYFFIIFAIFHVLSAEDYGLMQFDAPSGWRYADLKEYPKSVQMVLVGKGAHTFPPQLILNTEPFEGALSDYLKIVKDYNISQKTEWKDLGTIRTEAGEGSLSQVDVMTEWGMVRMMHFIMLRDNTVFILNASALKEEFAAYYHDFFHSMRSLKYKAPA